ncbi:MAG: DPP IV N-terminal domain-containing protein [Chloroflexota bacterium]
MSDDRREAPLPELRPASSDPLTIERANSFDPAREFRLHPRDRSVAYTAEAGGVRQIFVMPLRGGGAIQVTSSEKAISDPQWSPDGRRLAFVRDGTIWVVDADGSRLVSVTRILRATVARAGRPMVAAWRSCRGGEAGGRCGGSMRRSRGAVDRQLILSLPSRSR